MKNKVPVWIVFLLCFIFITGKVHAEELIARVTHWPPFYVEKNGKWTGITVDTYKALLHEAGVKFSFEKIPWKRALNNMKKQPIIMGHLTPLEERKKNMHFIGPHFNEVIGMAVKSSYANEKIKNFDDVVALCAKSGKQVGYLTGVYYSKEFNERIENDTDFSKFFFNGSQNINTSIMMIAGNRLFGMMDEKVVLDYSIKIKGYHKDIFVHDYEISKTPVYFGVSKTISKKTLEKLKNTNKVLLANGTYKNLLQKWLTKKYN